MRTSRWITVPADNHRKSLAARQFLNAIDEGAAVFADRMHILARAGRQGSFSSLRVLQRRLINERRSGDQHRRTWHWTHASTDLQIAQRMMRRYCRRTPLEPESSRKSERPIARPPLIQTQEKY